jgi:signal transduction histidine kinase
MDLSMSSRAVAGAVGRHDEVTEAAVAGWTHGPALSEVSMVVAARALSTAKAGLDARREALSAVLDRERTRMASALHDGLVQTVAGAVLELEAMQRAIERDPSQAIASLDRSKREIRKALGELRAVLFDLSAGQEKQRRPAESLTQYIEDVVRRWRLPARVSVEGNLAAVPDRVVSVAYVVIRESLANAAKHAAAGNVTVLLSVGERELVITVGDSGPGFTRRDEQAARDSHHVGLELLRRQVRDAGGRLRVESAPGKGTRIVARLPMMGAAR